MPSRSSTNLQILAIAFVAAAVLAAGLFWLVAPKARPPSFILISIDTLRADSLGCYGNDRWERSPSPVADRLARQGVRFERCFAPRGQTHPSIASMLSGQYPITHGLRENGQEPREGYATFAEELRRAGYATAGFVANMNAWTERTPRRPAWWTQGLETFGHGFVRSPVEEIRSNPQHQWLWDERVEQQALEWLKDPTKRGGRPFFLWVHFYDVHQPYAPHELYPVFFPEYDGPLAPNDGELEDAEDGPDPGALLSAATDEAALSGKPLPEAEHRYVLSCYDAGVAGADERAGRLLEEAGRQGLLDNTVVIYTADHGEELGDHQNYYYHGASIYDSVLRLPLVIAGPGVPSGARSDALVQNVDLAPAILRRAGIDLPPHIEGIPLPDLTADAAAGPLREWAVGEWQDLIYSISDGKTKYVFNPRGACPLKPPWGPRPDPRAGKGFVIDFEELYDLERDPREQNNLIDERRPDADRLRAALASWLAAPGRQGGFDPAGTGHRDEDSLLDNLGYTSGGVERRDVRMRR